MGPQGVAFPEFIGPERFRKETPGSVSLGALGGAWEGRPGRSSGPAKPLFLLDLQKRYRCLRNDGVRCSSRLEDALGFSPFQNLADGSWYGEEGYSPGFDALEDHGFCFELTFELTSDFTHVLLVENAPGVAPDLLAFCRAFASQHA